MPVLYMPENRSPARDAQAPRFLPFTPLRLPGSRQAWLPAARGVFGGVADLLCLTRCPGRGKFLSAAGEEVTQNA